MKSVVEWSLRNTPSMTTFAVAVLTVGIAALLMLRRERYPDFRPDEVVVRVPYPGASPTETEKGICLKVEEAIRSIVGVRKITSSATEGRGTVTAELDSDIDDPERVLNEIRSAVDRIPSFPEEAERPEVQLLVRFQSVLSVAVLAPRPPETVSVMTTMHGSAPSPATDSTGLNDRITHQIDSAEDAAAERQLRSLAEQVREELLLRPEISHVELWQAKPFQIDIEIPESSLRKYGLTHRDISEAVRRGNVELPAGEIKTDSVNLLVRAANKNVTGEEIAKLPVLAQPNGTVLTVGDLGTVHDGFADVKLLSRIDGRPCMSMKIRMTATEDMLKIRDAVLEYVANKPMPEGYTLKTWDDYSGQTRDRLDLLSRSGIAGLVLVFLMLGLFLDPRLAFWVALGIPISVFGTCAIMLVCDATLNVHSMFAFVMALGIVVDDAIVIAENVYAHRLRGKSGWHAAVDGTVEVAPAVISSVLTTVIAFIPLAFVTGEMGKWIAVMPLVLVSILLLSLTEAIFILPCHLSHSRLPEQESEVPVFQRFVQAALNRFIGRIYVPSLRWSLANPGVIFSGSASALLITAGLYLGGLTPFVFQQQLDWEFVYMYVEYPKGTPTETISAATLRLERALREIEREELQSDGGSLVKTLFRSVGYTNQIDNLRGEVYAEFDRDRIYHEKSSRDVIASWRERAGDFPGAERVVFWGINVAPGGRPIELSLMASDIQQLETVAERLKQHLATYIGVVDIQDSRGTGKWEFQIKLKPEAETLGIRLEDIARTLRGAFYGEEVMRLQRGRHEVKLMVRYPPQQRRSPHQLDEIRIRTVNGEVPLPVLADVTVKRGYSDIRRIDQQRAVTITANVDSAKANAPSVIRDLRQRFLAELLSRYPQVHARWEGQQEETRRSFSSLMIGFALALFGMYALLTLEFQSFLQPLIILAVIPFGFVGAVFGHLILGQSLTIFSLFGIVTLSGIVANDSIVLIDFINRRLTAGVPLQEALLESGRRRFRPVMLTSITTVAALLPILLERNTQAQVIIPMAISISFGLIVSTIWILVLVPSIFRVYAACSRPATAESDR